MGDRFGVIKMSRMCMLVNISGSHGSIRLSLQIVKHNSCKTKQYCY